MTPPPRLYLVPGREEIDRRKGAVPPGTLIEAWQDLYTPDIVWLGDEATRRVAYSQPRGTAPAALYWMGEASKAALDRPERPLSVLLAVPETAVPIYYGPRLTDIESLPTEATLRARVLSAHGIAVLWETYDAAGIRREHTPSDPVDPVFYLRRPRGGVVHLWRLFRTRAEARAHVARHLAGDVEAARWAEEIPVETFDALLARFGAPA